MTDSRKVLISVVASVVVIGLVVGLVLTFAIIPLPDFPSLADDPDPSIPGTVAFARWDDGDLCVWTVPASGGEASEVLCDNNIGFGEISPGWTPDGLLVVEQFGPNREVFRVVDPETGETIDRISFEETGAYDGPVGRDFVATQDGLSVYVNGDRGEPQLILEVPSGSERIVLEVEGPADYRFDWARLSPDGEWILVQDSEGRVLIVSPDGDPNARILTDDVDSWMAASWYIPGYAEGTWDPRR
ncbi:MAG: hypothetical protein HKN95_00745 [Acidimicrobiia bacterium]|nr:hypothetical protein [Acidimicrobiia bacterium]